MFIQVHEKPTQAQIDAYHMKVIEEDMYVDYRIDLSTIDAKQQESLCTLYKIDPKRLAQKTHLTLSYSTEI